MLFVKKLLEVKRYSTGSLILDYDKIQEMIQSHEGALKMYASQSPDKCYMTFEGEMQGEVEVLTVAINDPKMRYFTSWKVYHEEIEPR